MKEVGVRLKVGATGLENLQALTKELEGAGVSTQALDTKAEALAAELKRLGAEQALIDSFKRQKQALAEAAAEMEAAKAKASALGREIATTEAPTKQQAAAFDKARSAARSADEAYTAQRVTLQTLRGQMTAASVSAEGLAAAQVRVKREVAAAQTALRETADWAQRMATAERSAATQATALAAASRNAASAVAQQGAATQQAGGQTDVLAGKLRSLANIGVAGILGSQTGQMLRSVAETADAFSNLQARVRLVTGEGPAFTQAMDGIAQIALRTNSNLESTGTLFARLAQAGKEMGLGQGVALALTESVNQAIQLSGGSATASNAAITQLIQGLQSGVLRGEEFNSVMEQAPRLAQALATGLGLTTGELRKMAEAGKLSTDTVIRALQSQSATLQKEFATLPATVGRAIENLNTKWKLFIGGLNGSSGATASVAAGINGLADNLEALAGMATRAGTVLVAALAVQGVQALRSMAAQMLATGGAAALLSKNLNDIPKTINITVAAVGFEVGFQIGRMLYENSELARKLGIGVVQFFAEAVNGLQFLAEAAKAIFTSDTIDAALTRYTQRAEQQRAIFRGMYEDAQKTPDVVRAAAAAAAAEAKALGDNASQAGVKVAAAGAAGAAGMQSTATAAADAKGALEALTSAATTATREMGALSVTADKQAEALAKVALGGRKAAQTFSDELPTAIAKLSGPELESFRVSMTRALQESQTEARKLADELGTGSAKGAVALGRADQAARLLNTVLVATGTQAAQALGVDVVAASANVSKAFADSQQHLATLINTLPRLKQAGVDTAQVVSQALGKMIESAKNQAEIDAVVSRLKALGAAGRLSGSEVAGGLKQAEDKAKDLRKALEDATPGIQSLAEAARKLGIETRASLKQTADDFKQSWALIANSTEVTIAERIKAFARYRDAAIAANSGVETSELALQRQTLETQAKVAGLGKEFVRAMGEADGAIDRTKKMVNELGEEVNAAGERINQMAAGFNAVTDAAEEAENATNSVLRSTEYGKDKFALDGNGQRFTAGGQLQPPDASGNWEFVSDVRANSSNGPYGSVAVMRQGWWVPKVAPAAIRSAIETGTAQFNGGRGTSVFGSEAARQAASTSRTITINLAGSRTSFQVASDQDANTVEALLRQLEAASNRTGGG